MSTFIDNLTAAAQAVGADKVGIVFGIAQVEWESKEQRDAFLAALTEPGGGNG